MTLHACKKTSCCEEVSFLVDKKVLHFWRWEKKKNIQVSQGGGYTHPRMLLLWWKDTGTLCFVKPTLVWVFNSSFRYCWHFCSHPPIFLRLDQTVSLVFGLVDMKNNLVLNKKKAVNNKYPSKTTNRSRSFLSGKVSHCSFAFINKLFTDRVISKTFFTVFFFHFLESRSKYFSWWK